MDKITWTNSTRKLSELIPWSRNPRQIKSDQAKRLVESFDIFGQVETIAIGPGNEVYNGHQRLNVLAQKYGKDYEVEVRVSSRALTEKEHEKLTVFLHKGAAGEWDFDVLANEFELDELLEWGFNEHELQLGNPSDESTELEKMSDELPGTQALKDWVEFSSSDIWGIPGLLPDMCCDLPCNSDVLKTWVGHDITNVNDFSWYFYIWGSDSSRGMPFDRSIVSFYTNDERFELFWKETNRYIAKLINAGVRYCVTPNYSLWYGQARVLHLYNTYRSRFVGRYMQESGIYVIPDVNWSDESSFDYCLTGIPRDLPLISIQFQTQKTKEEKARAIYGLRRAIEELKPARLLLYGALNNLEWLYNQSGLSLPVIYIENRVAVRREYMESVRKEV